MQLGGSGERCKLIQRCLGRSTSGIWISCIWFALKSDIWWHHFY